VKGFILKNRIKEIEMNETYNKHWEMRGVQILVTSSGVRTNFGDLGLGRRVILKCILKKLDVIVCAEFKIGSRGKLLCIQ
jgi:hypothetical protein